MNDNRQRKWFSKKQDEEWLDKKRWSINSLKALPCFRSFDDYAKANPDGEHFRAWVTNRGHNRDYLLVPGVGPHGNLSGGYLWAHVVNYLDGTFAVKVHDSDDGCVSKSVMSLLSGTQELDNLEKLAPFDMVELKSFGYEFDM